MEYLFAFDDDKLTFTTPIYKSEVNWSFYKYYAEDEITIYIMTESNFYETVSFSSSEIGPEYFNLLKEIVKSKLIPVPY